MTPKHSVEVFMHSASSNRSLLRVFAKLISDSEAMSNINFDEPLSCGSPLSLLVLDFAKAVQEAIEKSDAKEVILTVTKDSYRLSCPAPDFVKL